MELQKVIHLGEKVGSTKESKLGKLAKTQIIVSIASIILGTLLHFTYQWSGQNLFIASFSAVNESVWEHLKLVFYPMLIAGIIEYFFVNKIANNYIEAKTIGIFSAILFIVVAFYTYTGILGTDFTIINILIFAVSILIGEWISYKLMKRRDESNIKTKILASAIILFFLICFIIFTYQTPKVNLFKDPLTGTYGINRE